MSQLLRQMLLCVPLKIMWGGQTSVLPFKKWDGVRKEYTKFHSNTSVPSGIANRQTEKQIKHPLS